jgi:nicotinamidase-related amidase
LGEIFEGVIGMGKKALLIIDVQMAMFTGETHVYKDEEVLNNIAAMLEKARSTGMPVIFVQHTVTGYARFEKGSPTWEIHPGIKPLEAEDVVEKSYCDSFMNTKLESVLKGKGITELIIAGMQTEYCIDTSVRRAFSMGYRNILVSDAHTTYDNEALTADQIIRHHNSVWDGDFAELKTTAEVLQEEF